MTIDQTTVDHAPFDSDEHLDLSDATLRLVWGPRVRRHTGDRNDLALVR